MSPAPLCDLLLAIPPAVEAELDAVAAGRKPWCRVNRSRSLALGLSGDALMKAAQSRGLAVAARGPMGFCAFRRTAP